MYGNIIDELFFGRCKMRLIKKFLLNACLYTVLILTLFYLFALISDMSESVISISKYFTILAFGAIISASVLIFETKISAFYKYLINYGALLAAFCTLFLSSESGSNNVVARVFAAVVIFTIVYALVLLFRYFFIALWTKATKTKKKK